MRKSPRPQHTWLSGSKGQGRIHSALGGPVTKTVCCLLVIVGACCFFLNYPTSAATQAESQCISCHTDVKGLIKLGWEVEKVKPKKKSAETAGEG